MSDKPVEPSVSYESKFSDRNMSWTNFFDKWADAPALVQEFVEDLVSALPAVLHRPGEKLEDILWYNAKRDLAATLRLAVTCPRDEP